MDFAFSDGVPVGSECRRVLMEEVEGAISQLAHFNDGPDVAIHETRKHNKRLRSVLLLARPVLDSGDLSQANRLIRDAARLFSEARDALVLQETCEKLAAHFPNKSEKAFLTVLKALAARHADLLRDEELPCKITRAFGDFREAGEVIGRWNWDQVTYEEVFSAVVSNYRLGYKDFEKARASRDPEECHDWRKRAKYLSYHLTLLTPLDPAEIGEWAVATGELASSLGEHHDLAVFQTAIGDGSEYGISEKAARSIMKLSAKRCAELEDLAFEEGKVIYRDTAEEMHLRFAKMVGAAV
jgi:CHAD domain-containing protein